MLGNGGHGQRLEACFDLMTLNKLDCLVATHPPEASSGDWDDAGPRAPKVAQRHPSQDSEVGSEPAGVSDARLRPGCKAEWRTLYSAAGQPGLSANDDGLSADRDGATVPRRVAWRGRCRRKRAGGSQGPALGGTSGAISSLRGAACLAANSGARLVP